MKRFFRIRRAPYVALTVLVVVALFLITPPFGEPKETHIKIRSGDTIVGTASLLKENNVVRFATVFELLARVFGSERGIIAGEYTFVSPENAFSVARRLTQGDFQTKPVRVTIPEGATVMDIATILADNLTHFDTLTFLGAAKEGYVFPDTYFFLPRSDAQEVLDTIQKNFEKQTQTPTFKQALARSGKTLEEVIIMASLLEKEAPYTQDRRVIAGILWNRIEVGMPLQVDAVFPYLIGVGSLDLTRRDLQLKSAYNTYTNKGLPPGPIGNPGLDSLIAAMTPVDTNYVFYLSDMQGNFHYCATYTCHLANKKKYLDS